MTTEEIAKRLAAGLTYDEITVSIAGYPFITRTYRTDADAQRIIKELTPVVETLIDERLKEEARWLRTSFDNGLAGGRYSSSFMDGYSCAIGWVEFHAGVGEWAR